MRVEPGSGCVVKRAESADERLTLAREARALRACAHPGVVAILGGDDEDPPRELVLQQLPGSSLADLERPPVPVLAGMAAAVASTLADLHDLGWAHGAVQPQHVLMDSSGRPVLCSLSAAVGPDDPDRSSAAALSDVIALARMVRDRLPAGTDRRLDRLLAVAAGSGRRSRPVPARQLARRLVQLVPDARLQPVPDGPGPETHGCTGTGSAPVDRPRRVPAPRRRPPVRLTAGVVAVLVAGVGLGVLHPWSRPGAPPPPGAARPSRSVGAPVRSVVVPASGARYLLSGPGAAGLLTVEGRWNCGPVRPASLDPSTGWIWVFRSWPGPGRSVHGVPVARVAGASGLAVAAAGPGCDDLVALAGGGRRVQVPALPARGSS